MLSRIWTRVAVSISYDDNHYTTGTSTAFLLYVDSEILFLLIYLHQLVYFLKNINIEFYICMIHMITMTIL